MNVFNEATLQEAILALWGAVIGEHLSRMKIHTNGTHFLYKIRLYKHLLAYA